MSASELVSEVEKLIAKYSYNDVIQAAKLVKSFSDKPVILNDNGGNSTVKNVQSNDQVHATHIAFGYPWYVAIKYSDIDVINSFVAENNLINAIKKVREITGLGLKDAKDLVELRFK